MGLDSHNRYIVGGGETRPAGRPASASCARTRAGGRTATQPRCVLWGRRDRGGLSDWPSPIRLPRLANWRSGGGL
jgi:hypothetical protein